MRRLARRTSLKTYNWWIQIWFFFLFARRNNLWLLQFLLLCLFDFLIFFLLLRFHFFGKIRFFSSVLLLILFLFNFCKFLLFLPFSLKLLLFLAFFLWRHFIRDYRVNNLGFIRNKFLLQCIRFNLDNWLYLWHSRLINIYR